MTSTRAAMTYAAALNRNELFACFGLRHDIPSLLHPEEEVLLVLPGVAGDYPDVMIATATRFVLASVAGPFKVVELKRETPAAEVTGVRYRPGLLRRVRVLTASGPEIRMIPNCRVDAERFTDEFDHLIRTGSLPS